jgi:hypothetical protein
MAVRFVYSSTNAIKRLLDLGLPAAPLNERVRRTTDELHDVRGLDFWRLPQPGEVKRANQPRMGDESIRRLRRCSEQAWRGSMRRSLARQTALVSRVRRRALLRRLGGRLNDLRRHANPNRLSGFCRLPSRVFAALRVHRRSDRPSDHPCDSKATILCGCPRRDRARGVSHRLAGHAPRIFDRATNPARARLTRRRAARVLPRGFGRKQPVPRHTFGTYA